MEAAERREDPGSGMARAKALRQDRAWHIQEMCSNTVRRREERRNAVRAAGRTSRVHGYMARTRAL